MFARNAALALVLFAAPVAFGAEGTFDYNPDSDIGPSNWANLDLEGNQCGGSENSPIAITDLGCTIYKDYILREGSCTVADVDFQVTNNGVLATFKEGCEKPNLEMATKEGVFDAVQFHIHTGSEHTVNGKTFGAELHIVHLRRGCPRNTKRCYAVVGTKLNPANNFNNPLFNIFLEGWIKKHNKKEEECGNVGDMISHDFVTDDTTLIDPYQFNRDSRFFHYAGGLTTPPCSEVVWWNLDDSALAISPEQYSQLGQIILDYKDAECKKGTLAHDGGTSRAPVELNGRTVDKICPLAYKPDDSADLGNVEPEESSASTNAAVVGAITTAANVVGQLM